MPAGDGTGPTGKGPLTGGQRGPCPSARTQIRSVGMNTGNFGNGMGFGRGRGRGMGRGLGRNIK